MKSFMLLFACLFNSIVLFAQPANDAPCTATVLTPVYAPDLSCTGTGVSFNYNNATPSPVIAPDCYFLPFAINDVWFQFTATASGRVAVKVTSTADGVMSVYKDFCSVSEAHPLLACNDDTLSAQHPICIFDVAEGKTYLVRYWVINAASASSSICIVTDAPPANSSQRVGIGIANPQANLDVNGTVQIRGGNPEEGNVLTSNAQGKASWRKVNSSIIQAPLSLTTDLFATPVITVNHPAFAGVGLFATAGQSSGHYAGSASIVASSKDQVGIVAHSDQSWGANFFTYNGNNAALLVANLDSTYGDPTAADFNGSLRIHRASSGSWIGPNSGNLTIEGNVGIGDGPNSYTALQMASTLGNKISLWGSALFGAHYGIGIQNNLLQLYTSNASADVAMGYGSSAAFTETMRIKGSGNVGIGTNAPSRKLEVVSTGTNVITIASKSAFGAAGVEFVSDHGLASQWRPAFIQSNDLGNYTGRLEFYTNGVGVANTYGAVKGLEVRNGTTLTATGTVGSYSDSRLKNSIHPFTDGLNVIRQINPVAFHYNPNSPFPSNDEQVGILAQELEKVAPYMVKQTNENGYKDLRWINNQAYTFLLINAVKEQQAELENVKKELIELKARLDALLRQTKQ